MTRKEMIKLLNFMEYNKVDENIFFNYGQIMLNKDTKTPYIIHGFNCYDEAVEILEKAGLVKWGPEENEEYYYINHFGDICSELWDFYEGQQRMYNMGNCFKTREQAEKHELKIVRKED